MYGTRKVHAAINRFDTERGYNRWPAGQVGLWVVEIRGLITGRGWLDDDTPSVTVTLVYEDNVAQGTGATVEDAVDNAMPHLISAVRGY